MNKLAVYLNQHIDGVVYSAPNILEKYSRDRSILHYKPRLVALPANDMDVRRLVKFVSQLASKGMSMPITVRGTGYSKTGAAIGSGIILSTERLKSIQEIDVRQRLIRVQAGATLAEIRTALDATGLELPVFGDPRETIGGLVSTCAPASANTKASTILDFVEEMEVVLADGSLAHLRQMSHSKAAKIASKKSLEGKIYKDLSDWLGKNAELVDKVKEATENKAWYPGIKDVVTKRGVDLSALFCGAEGSIGVITELILRVEPIFESPNYIAVPCANPKEFAKAVELLEKEKFTDIVFYDTEIFAEIEKTGKSLKFFRKPSKDGYLLVANAKDDSRAKRRSKMRALGRKLPSSMRLIIADENNIGEFAAVHENLIAYLSESNLEYRVPVVDQVYIPAEKRAEFLSRVDDLAKEFSMTLPVYGSIDYNIYTVRPKLRPDDIESYKTMISFLRAYIKLVGEMEGHVCGGAPEGRFLAPFLKAEVNPAIFELNKKIREIMDPDGVFTDGIKTDADARLIFKHFRTEYGEDLQSSY